MTNGGYIKLWRSIADDPLWTSAPDAWFRVAIGVLVKANWKPGKWWDGTREVEIPAGGLVTSVDKMAAFCRVSVRQCRGAFRFFLATKWAGLQTTNRYHIVIVRNWDRYQGEGSGGGQTKVKPMTTIEEGKKGRIEKKTDLDCPPTNEKKPHSQAGVNVAVESCKKYPKLRAALSQYMEGDHPTDRLVVEVMDAANGEAEDTVIACLSYLYNERGLKPGTKNGPRQWSWFPVVVQDYFERIEARRDAAHPCGYSEWEDRNDAKQQQKFDEMTSAIELPDAIQ